MTDEAIFYRRFVADVRRCAVGRAPASVARDQRRIDIAMVPAPEVRDELHLAQERVTR